MWLNGQNVGWESRIHCGLWVTSLDQWKFLPLFKGHWQSLEQQANDLSSRLCKNTVKEFNLCEVSYWPMKQYKDIQLHLIKLNAKSLESIAWKFDSSTTNLRGMIFWQVRVLLQILKMIRKEFIFLNRNEQIGLSKFFTVHLFCVRNSKIKTLMKISKPILGENSDP